jgi:anti-sigma-K factor RskA
MNSDPHDSAAWRTFGMLDAEESARFTDAMRHDPELRRTSIEMDRLATAIAAISADPVIPAPEQLERLQRALGHSNAPRKCPLWLAVSGWSTAAALAALLAWRVFVGVDEQASTAPVVAAPPPPVPESNQDTPMETRRLMGEIEILRQNLEEFHQRDRALFQVVPGRALQMVMTMVPPGADASGLATPAMLGDALAALNRAATAKYDEIEPEIPPTGENPGDLPLENVELAVVSPPVPPSAVPIYDAARDIGTLVVSNLPPAPQGRVYHLWVSTNASSRPVYLGKLPDNSASGAESFDFSLGSTMILPTAFMLTLDPANSPASPGDDNTILAGPPAAAR